MVKPSIALADFLEKWADTDLLREMITHIVERVMHFEVENLCAASYGERTPESAQISARVDGGAMFPGSAEAIFPS